MTIHEFMVQFPDDKSCRLHFKKVREQKGIECKRCHGKRHYWLQKKWQWQCKKCRFRTTLRSGTSIHYAKLSFHKWYLCMALMSATKKGISAKEMQRQLGHKRYRTIWELMQKIRAGMGRRDDVFNLDNILEADQKRFKSTSVVDRKKSSKLDFAYMESRQKEPDFQEYLDSEINVEEHVQSKLCWIGERRSLSPGVHFFFNTHLSYDARVKSLSAGQNWINIIAGNARKNILGIYHKISTKYLQHYLDEFCFRLNRRQLNEKRFDSLVFAVADSYGGTLPTIQENFSPHWKN